MSKATHRRKGLFGAYGSCVVRVHHHHTSMAAGTVTGGAESAHLELHARSSKNKLKTVHVFKLSKPVLSDTPPPARPARTGPSTGTMYSNAKECWGGVLFKLPGQLALLTGPVLHQYTVTDLIYTVSRDSYFSFYLVYHSFRSLVAHSYNSRTQEAQAGVSGV